MHCLIRTCTSFMEFEHYEALIFSNNKDALQSIANRINPFTIDAYIVVATENVSNHSTSVIYCHQNDSDINYSIILDDYFCGDSLANEKSLNGVISERAKQGNLGEIVRPKMY